MHLSLWRSHWFSAFGVATFILLLLGGHSYIVLSYTDETSKWVEQFFRTVIWWYLWAAFFPVILHLAGHFRFAPAARLKSVLVHTLAGAAIAVLHTTIQIFLIDWLFYPDRDWNTIRKILQDNFLTTLLWRFFVYQSILAICIAVDSYRRAREMEIQASQMEADILQAQVESLKMRLDPDFLFDSLKQLSNFMKRDLDEAESTVARLGEYLRMRLDHSLKMDGYTPEETLAANDEVPLEPGPVVSNPVRKWLVITGVFTAIAIYFTLQKIMINSIRGTTIDWPQHLLDYSGWYVWALITPFVLYVSAKYPVQKQAWLKHAPIHLVVLTVSWFFATIAMEAVHWAANLGQYSYWERLPLGFARSPFSLDIICYATIVAVESAMRFHRRFEFGRIRKIKLTGQLAGARLHALKMQLHPHFLFNALNSLSELMREDPVAAEKMIQNLEMFLRLTVNHDHLQEVPFEKELEFLECYLAIENVRFQDRLNVKMEIEPETMKVPVPNLMLQPIVENAIRHGIAPRSSRGQIEIQAKRDNGMLQLSVRDNGPGISQSKKKAISARSGLGLSNTRERLIQLYGDNHRFELVNAPEGGLIVTLEIPVVHGKTR
ncbi:histidine kinase [bacterium]|nr:histidine kinase [bacterium]MCI0601765.1 histidine kinase [bacterium]